MSKLDHATKLLSGTPPIGARPVSLAVHHYFQTHKPGAVVVGFSGGADSLALLTCVIDVASRQNIPVLSVSVDHRWRPDSALQSEEAAELARTLGATAKVVALEDSTHSEALARQGRYAVLSKCASQLQSSLGENLTDTHILVGHTQDDQAETVLLRLGRGASAKSLAAMRSKRLVAPSVFLGRPLLSVRRRQTIEFCQALELPFFSDPSNDPMGPWKAADGAPFRRSALRVYAIPALTKALQKDSVPALAAVATSMQQDEDALALWAKKHFEINADLEIKQLQEVPVAVRKRVYRLALEAGGYHLAQPHQTQLEAVDALVAKWQGQGAVDFPGGWQIYRKGKNLVVKAT